MTKRRRCCCDSGSGDPCTFCTSTPAQIQIDLASIANSDCTHCTGMNGSYVLDQSEINPCFYEWSQTEGLECTGPHVIEMVIGNAGLECLVFHKDDLNLEVNSNFNKSHTAPIDCSAIDDDLPRSSFLSSDNSTCDHTSTTCHATAL